MTNKGGGIYGLGVVVGAMGGEWVAYEKLYEALRLYSDVLVLSPAVFETFGVNLQLARLVKIIVSLCVIDESTCSPGALGSRELIYVSFQKSKT